MRLCLAADGQKCFRRNFRMNVKFNTHTLRDLGEK